MRFTVDKATIGNSFRLGALLWPWGKLVLLLLITWIPLGFVMGGPGWHSDLIQGRFDPIEVALIALIPIALMWELRAARCRGIPLGKATIVSLGVMAAVLLGMSTGTYVGAIINSFVGTHCPAVPMYLEGHLWPFLLALGFIPAGLLLGGKTLLIKKSKD